jgi:hypothetical protein
MLHFEIRSGGIFINHARVTALSNDDVDQAWTS